jgi:putative endonuclease
MKGYNKKLGQWGEELAISFYKSLGYQVIAINSFVKNQKLVGEVDIIVSKDQEIVFVEVKTRTSDRFGYPEQAVTVQKKKKLSHAIDQYLLEHQAYEEFFPRFDILAIDLSSLQPKYNHFENVTLK